MRKTSALMSIVATTWLVIAPAEPAAAQTGKPAPIPVASEGLLPAASTMHKLVLSGCTIEYRATWSEHVLRDSSGQGEATISATSYVRANGTGGAEPRPVMFLFNGGPGASSSPLHMNALGPKRLGARDARGQRPLIDNAETVLDMADLVFIDPVGTGFSRPLREGGGKAYWSADGDAAATLALVRAWLAREGRARSPLYMVGESYGGYRLGLMARAIADLDVAGLVLVSPALEFATSPDQVAINALPSMAVAAWQHRRRPDDNRTARQVWEDARRFAQGDYASLLQQGAALPEAELTRASRHIAGLIQLPEAMIRESRLRVDTQVFLENLLAGRLLSRLDTRVTAPPAPPKNPDRPAAANDPALGLGQSNVIISEPLGRYLREDLRVAGKRDYYSLTLDVNFAWDFRPASLRPPFAGNVAQHIGTLMAEQRETRLLVYGGHHDLATPVLGTHHAITHGGIPLDRVRFVFLDTGHSVFDGEGRAQSAAILREFMGRAGKNDCAQKDEIANKTS